MLLAIILLILGIVIILLEFFIPSFGLIGVIGVASIIGSIVTAFRINSTAGAVFLTASLIIVPALMLIFFKIFPRTFIGKKLILHKQMKQQDGFESAAGDYTNLRGKTGMAVTDLRPSGTIEIEQRKYSALTSGEYIVKNKRVNIVKTEGSKIIVTEAD